MTALKHKLVTLVAMSLANVIAGMVLIDSNSGYNPKYVDDSLYFAGDRSVGKNELNDEQIVQVWLTYLNNLRNSEFRQGNSYDDDTPDNDLSPTEIPEQDRPSSAENTDDFANFENKAAEMSLPQRRQSPKLHNTYASKRFGGDGGIFERFRTNLYGGRTPGKQSANRQMERTSADQNLSSSNQVGNENNNVNSAFFWKEKLLPPGVLNILSRN